VELKKKLPISNLHICKESARENTNMETQQTPIEHNKEH